MKAKIRDSGGVFDADGCYIRPKACFCTETPASSSVRNLLPHISYAREQATEDLPQMLMTNLSAGVRVSRNRSQVSVSIRGGGKKTDVMSYRDNVNTHQYFVTDNSF